jgi:hypothetical protein
VVSLFSLDSLLSYDVLLFICLQYDVSQFSCLPCAAGCARCDDASTCDDDVGASRVILLTLQVFIMAASIVSGVAIVRLRKSKVCHIHAASYINYIFYI